jgi:hypothetical protein
MDAVTDFDALVTLGVYDYVGPDDNGEPQYVLNIKQALELCPEIYWAQRNQVDLAIMDAVTAGFVDWDINPNTLEETLSFNV